MQKNRTRWECHRISDLFSDEYTRKFGDVTQVIFDAVVRYNQYLPLARNFEGKRCDERFVKEAEEESTQLFINEIFDIAQRENTKNE